MVLTLPESAQHIHRLCVYTPFGTAPTNVYVLEGDRIGLFDTGVDHPRARMELHEGLKSLGIAETDVELVIVSHGHIDHHGLAHEFPRADIRVGWRDLHKVTTFTDHTERYSRIAAGLVHSWGVPRETAEKLREALSGFTKMASDISEAVPVQAGNLLDGFGPSLRVLEMPGHTEGLICLYREADGVLLSSDHLLESITPNPGLYIGDNPPRSGLADYVASLRRLLDYSVQHVLPGHGPEFLDPSARMETILRHHTERLRLIQRQAGPGKTVFAISQELFPALDPTNVFLATREVYGHLEILERQGRVQRISTGNEQGSDLYVAA